MSRSSAASRRGSAPAASPAAAEGRSALAARIIVIAAVLLGLAARVVSVQLAPQHAYLWDHTCNLSWGTYAYEHGPHKLYEYDRSDILIIRVQDPRSGAWLDVPSRNAHLYNYPPGSAAIFWFKGWLWTVLEPQPTTLQLSERDAQRIGAPQTHVTARVSNTVTARLVSAAPAVAFDFLMAWGVMHLVRAARGGRRAPLREAIAFALTLLAPPVFLDSAFWGQADSWITALLVWCLAALLRERHWLTGGLYGLAIVIKPQAILLAPVLAFAALALLLMPGGGWRRALAMWKAAAAAAVVVGVVSAPFMLNDARDPHNPDGALRWFQRSYVGTIGDERYDRVTLNAFNAWWLHYVYHRARLEAAAAQAPPGEREAALRRVHMEALDANAATLGIRNRTLGTLLLGCAVLLAGFLCARMWSWGRDGWLVCTFLILLAAFALPTKVHERYIYYCIPFAIALASLRPRVWTPPLVVLLIVGSAEMVSNIWVNPNDPGVRTTGTVFAVMVLAALAYSFLVLVRREPAGDGLRASNGR